MDANQKKLPPPKMTVFLQAKPLSSQWKVQFIELDFQHLRRNLLSRKMRIRTNLDPEVVFFDGTGTKYETNESFCNYSIINHGCMNRYVIHILSFWKYAYDVNIWLWYPGKFKCKYYFTILLPASYIVANLPFFPNN